MLSLFFVLSDSLRSGATRVAQTRARWRATLPREYRYVRSLTPDCPPRDVRSTTTPTFPARRPSRHAETDAFSASPRRLVTSSAKSRVTDTAARAARGRALGTIKANATCPRRSHVSYSRAYIASRAL